MKMETLRHKLTSEDILNILIEQHRLCSPLDPEADSSVELSFKSTIDKWRYANDLISWQPLSKVLNESFNIDDTRKEWKNVLEPSSYKTLKDVCELISLYSKHSDILPKNQFGQKCLSAAVFLTLKKYLKQRGIDVAELKPSSSVSYYLTNYYGDMITQTTIISNGKEVLKNLKLKRNKKGFLNYINIFDKNRYTLDAGDIKTFSDLTKKIIEANSLMEKKGE